MPHLRLRGPGLVLVTGASGSGKSSLLKALTGTLEDFQGGARSGEILQLIDATPQTLRIGYVPQDPIDGLLAHDAESEFRLRLLAAGWAPESAEPEARRRIAACALEGREHLGPNELSGGERKRLALRAALVHEPQLVLLDEPLNHLDAQWRPLVVDEVLGLAERRLVVLTTHDVDPWLELALQVLVLREGRVAWQGDAQEFSASRPLFGELRQAISGARRPAASFSSEPMLVAQRLAAIRGRPLFQDWAIRLPKGLHAVTGPNGSGKTTLLRILGGLEDAQEGTIHLAGDGVASMPLRKRAARIAVHMEEPGRLFFLPTVEEELAYQPRNAHMDDVADRVEHALRRLGLDPLRRRHPVSLSGGEQERVALACLDAARPALIVLDEPTHGLDGDGWRRLHELLAHWRKEACIVLATHDEELVHLADSVHEIDQGRLIPIRRGSETPLVEVRPRTST